jgi:hypothetical protein
MKIEIKGEWTMKKIVLPGLLMMLLIPIRAMAQSDFDGTWKIDLTKSVMPTKPDVFLLQNGTYQCKSCVPMINVKADGQNQSVTGNPYYDAIRVKVVDDRSIEETQTKNGKVVATSKIIVSPDGNTATFEFTDNIHTSRDPIVGKGSMVRVGKGKHPKGAHAISGSWRVSKMESLSDSALTFTLRVVDDTLNMTSPTGQSYAAKLDGTDAPYKGDSGVSSVSVRRLSPRTVEETDKRDGKVICVKRMMIDPADLKTVSTIVTDNLTGASTLLVASKQ